MQEIAVSATLLMQLGENVLGLSNGWNRMEEIGIVFGFGSVG